MLNKAEQTRQSIVECALKMARSKGISALTLGTVADQMRMSKTGVFVRTGSIEALQLQVLAAHHAYFRRQVVDPANAAPAGLPRLRAMFGYWTTEVSAHGCLYLSCASELGDRPGPLRDAVLADVAKWRLALEQCARHAIDCGQLDGATDVKQLICDMVGLILMLHHNTRLLGTSDGVERSKRAFERLLTECEGAASTLRILSPSRRASSNKHARCAVLPRLVAR